MRYITISTEDLKDMLQVATSVAKAGKSYEVCVSDDNTDGEGKWHADVDFDNGAWVWSFNETLNDYNLDFGKIEDTAKKFNISPYGLKDSYRACMSANFEQDLWDIANENEDDIRNEYGAYGEEA